MIAETDQVVLEDYMASQPLAPLLEEVLSTRAGQLDIDAIRSQEPSARGADQSRHPTRPRMPQQLLQWHVEQQLGADSFDAFLTSTATQLCQQTLYRPAWSPPRMALALHNLAATRADEAAADWPVPLLLVADAAIFAAARDVFSLDSGIVFDPPRVAPGDAVDGWAGRFRNLWPHLRDGYANQLPAVEELPTAKVERLLQQAQRNIAGHL